MPRWLPCCAGCLHSPSASMQPNNSFKPTPLHGREFFRYVAFLGRGRAAVRLNSGVMTHSRHPRRVSCQSNKRVPKLNWRCVRFASPQRRLVRRFSSLVMESNLVRAFRPSPSQLQRRLGPVVVEPRCFRRTVSVGALPHLTNPSAIDAPLPANACGRCKPVRRPCPSFCRVFQHAAKSAHGFKRVGKASAVVSGSVVFAAPPLVIDRRKRAPQLARRVRNDRPRPTIFAGVSLFRPSVNSRQSCIASIRLYKNCGNVSHNNSFKPTPLRGAA